MSWNEEVEDDMNNFKREYEKRETEREGNPIFSSQSAYQLGSPVNL